MPEALLSRSLNVDLSGGEKKRNETLQMTVLRPAIAVLDEIDSGLDIDALRVVAGHVEQLTDELGVGVLAVTHYARLLQVLRADVVHVLSRGRIVDTGGPELADELERTGYAAYGGEDQPVAAAATGHASAADPFADPLA
jgi:Fe-S cluster assembly ATP-binding protein